MRIFLSVIASLLFFHTQAQEEQTDSIQKIDEVVIHSPRIPLSIRKQSQSFSLVSKEVIQGQNEKSIDEILQQVPGIDIRRRGIQGMQSDLYIRGGNFNQSLIMIDGIPMDDAQSGHHNMNAILPTESIDKIEIIKGAASRIFGQNAMNGVVNIITKPIIQNQAKLHINAGSYHNYASDFFYQRKEKELGMQLFVAKRQAEGYRYNTDFDYWNASAKLHWKDFKLLQIVSKRKFGANGFYASPQYKDQYEETLTNLLALQKKSGNTRLQLYWRQNQDMYLFVRNNPGLYRNFHKNNKIGFSVNSAIYSQWGKTGWGIALHKTYLQSNNLGNRSRNVASFFAEHQYRKGRFDVTPGVHLSYYSDFKFFAYPGVNMGWSFSKNTKVYANAGYTYRIPTYTNLYYNSRVEEGNPDLQPEEAFTTEVGFRTTINHLQGSMAVFTRKSTGLIDWIKYYEEDKWHAQNLRAIRTSGIETELQYAFRLGKTQQNCSLSYTFLKEDKQPVQVPFSRYLLNTFKHQVHTAIRTRFSKSFSDNMDFRFVERVDNTHYFVWDWGFQYTLKKWTFSLQLNNILNTEYTETNLVPMPKRNFMTGLRYAFFR